MNDRPESLSKAEKIHSSGSGHIHNGASGHSHGHSHENVQNLSHGHTHTETKAVVNRLSRAIGHLESVKRMVENGQDCSDVLIQLAAVRSALTNTGKIILKDHLDHCIVDAVEHNDMESLEQFKKAIEQFIK